MGEGSGSGKVHSVRVPAGYGKGRVELVGGGRVVGWHCTG